MTSPASPLKLLLLGGCRLYDGKQERDLPGVKARALLVYLCCNRGPVSRQHLVTLLWGSRFEGQARQSLRQTLTKLRKALGRNVLVTSGDSVVIAEDAIATDVAAFEAAVERDAPREALALYRGELAAELAVAEEDFTRWLEAERGRFRGLAAGCLHALAEASLARDPRGAADFARAAVELDELDEVAHRLLLKALMAGNRRGEAIRHFERMEKHFKEKVQANLELATRELGQAIRAGDLASTVQPAASGNFRPAKGITELSAGSDPNPPARFDSSDAAAAKLELPARPSIAVLPFTAFSDEPEHKHFADGMTEDIVTALSRIPDLAVAARNNTWSYEGCSTDPLKASEELGVSCILEGSVRVANEKVRVTAQLIEAASGHHLWSERYDGELVDIFQVQDDITRNIALALQITLTYGELARLWEGQTKDLRAWEKMVEGRRLFNLMNRNDMISARRLFKEALAIDPNYGGALLQLGLTHWWEARYVLDVDVEDALAQAEAVVERLFELGGNESAAHYLKGYVAFIRRRFDVAIPELEQAVALSPNDSWMTGVLGQVYIFAGQPEKGAETLRQAMRLSPYYPDWYPYNLALAYAWCGKQLDEAIELAEWYINRLPTDPYGYTNLAIVQAFAGLEEQAASTIQLLRRRHLGFTSKNLRRSELYKDAEDLDRILTVLHRAGLPDGASST